MDVPDPAGVSTPELAALLAREVTDGLNAAQLADPAPGFAVNRVRVRIGEPGQEMGDIGWQAELEIGAVSEGAPNLTLSVPAAISQLAVSVIDGLSPVWASRMAEIGIATIGDLAAASPEVLVDAAGRFGSRRVFAWAARARSCAVPLPPDAQLRGTSAGHALDMTPAQLSAHFDIARSSAISLWYALSSLSAALKPKALESLRMA